MHCQRQRPCLGMLTMRLAGLEKQKKETALICQIGKKLGAKSCVEHSPPPCSACRFLFSLPTSLQNRFSKANLRRPTPSPVVISTARELPQGEARPRVAKLAFTAVRGDTMEEWNPPVMEPAFMTARGLMREELQRRGTRLSISTKAVGKRGGVSPREARPDISMGRGNLQVGR